MLYNGIQENDDTVLSLSDCFENPGGDIDVIVHVYNINPGHRLPDCCRPLEDYSQFVSAYRDRITSVGAEQAANKIENRVPPCNGITGAGKKVRIKKRNAGMHLSLEV